MISFAIFGLALTRIAAPLTLIIIFVFVVVFLFGIVVVTVSSTATSTSASLWEMIGYVLPVLLVATFGFVLDEVENIRKLKVLLARSANEHVDKFDSVVAAHRRIVVTAR